MFLSSADFFFQNKNIYFRNTIRVSTSLDPDQAHFLDLNCLSKYQQTTLVGNELKADDIQTHIQTLIR